MNLTQKQFSELYVELEASIDSKLEKLHVDSIRHILFEYDGLRIYLDKYKNDFEFRLPRMSSTEVTYEKCKEFVKFVENYREIILGILNKYQ